MIHAAGDSLIVAYRGSKSNIDDIMVDINPKHHKVLNGKGYVHKGFFERSEIEWGFTMNETKYEIVQDSIFDLMMKSKAKRIIITGHSMGGSVSILDYFKLLEIQKRFPEFKRNVYVTTFGAPVSISKEVQEYIVPSSDYILNFFVKEDPMLDILNYMYPRKK